MNVRVAAVVSQKEKVLFLHYNYSSVDVYNLPGGNLEFGEEMRECLERELIEELMIQTEVGLEPIFSGEVHLNGKDTLHVIYEAKIISGKPKINPNETTAKGFFWLDIEELHSKNLYPNVTKAIIDWKTGTLKEPFLGTIEQQWY